MTVWVTAGCWPVHAVLSRVGWIMKWNHFLWCFFSAEDDLKSKSVKKFCSVVWNRVHISIFVLRGCQSTITDCFFCSAEPSVMNKKYKRINCIFIHHPPHPVRFPKSAASYTLESCRVFSSTADRNRKTPRLWRKIIWCLPLQSVSCRNCFSDELKPSVNVRGGNPAPSKHPAGPTSLTRREPDRVHTNIPQLVQLNCDGDRNQKRLVFQSDPNIHTWLQPEIWKQNPDNLIWATVAPETPTHEKPPNTSFNTGVSCCYWLLHHCQRAGERFIMFQYEVRAAVCQQNQDVRLHPLTLTHNPQRRGRHVTQI